MYLYVMYLLFNVTCTCCTDKSCTICGNIFKWGVPLSLSVCTYLTVSLSLSLPIRERELATILATYLIQCSYLFYLLLNVPFTFHTYSPCTKCGNILKWSVSLSLSRNCLFLCTVERVSCRSDNVLVPYVPTI